MRNLKTILAIALLVAIPVLINMMPNNSTDAKLIIASVIGLLFIFHFAIRKNLFFKSYFLSPFSILSEKYSSTSTYDIPIDLMFDKTLEVLESSKFKVQHSVPERFEIFATTKISWRSWGENLYIDFSEENSETTMNFQSVSVMGLHSWEKNRKNSEHLINTIEESLII